MANNKYLILYYSALRRNPFIFKLFFYKPHTSITIKKALTFMLRKFHGSRKKREIK